MLCISIVTWYPNVWIYNIYSFSYIPVYIFLCLKSQTLVLDILIKVPWHGAWMFPWMWNSLQNFCVQETGGAKTLPTQISHFRSHQVFTGDVIGFHSDRDVELPDSLVLGTKCGGYEVAPTVLLIYILFNTDGIVHPLTWFWAICFSSSGKCLPLYVYIPFSIDLKKFFMYFRYQNLSVAYLFSVLKISFPSLRLAFINMTLMVSSGEQLSLTLTQLTRTVFKSQLWILLKKTLSGPM